MRAPGLALLTALVCFGCGPSREVRELRHAREARVERVLGLHPPFRADHIYFDDCGVWHARLFGDGDSLDVYLDRRPFPPDSAGSSPASWGRVWTHAAPDSPQARALAFDSAPESAVVDLVRLAVSTMYAAAEESVLVWRERAASRKPHPEYEASVLSAKLTPREHTLRDLRSFLGSMEWRRQMAAAAP